MERTLKILGKRGRTTIPFEIRQRLGFRQNDILSFEDNGVDTVTVKRETLCSCPRCGDTGKEAVDRPEDEVTLLEFLDSLSLTEQRAALIHLSVKWAELEGRKANGR
ncbi:MAG: AbrB/MazE/SpoVT family DNA-binding domain-containing protein [Clostridiales bacterium]|nr:AbrB/MazE/SpoVT family DNA-binding domain-containing protein [Clostridiales bacterium]